MKLRIAASLIMTIATGFTLSSCDAPGSAPQTNPVDESLSGGSQTIFDGGLHAFSTGLPAMSSEHSAMHERGDQAFSMQFLPFPSQLNSGLGPVFNSNSCSGCHVNDGRGKPPSDDETLTALLFRISIPGTGAHGGPNPVPGFGGQLQQRAIYGVQPEAHVTIAYSYETYTFADGESYELARPHYTLSDAYRPLPGDLLISPRIAPAVFGMGLLESIPEAVILARADENDANHDGISGKPNRVWDASAQSMRIGRFGWKAEHPSVIQQTAGALNEDMGITNPIFGVESTRGQSQYNAAADSGVIELPQNVLHDLAAYMQTLGVPARRGATDPIVLRGKQVFANANCTGCHTPMTRTGANAEFPELSDQTIFPYTDLLLHDMGEDLSDHRPAYDATGAEWRTPPLWGIGLTEVVNGHTQFLHDGRARSLLEAIMWHGGEAARSREYVRKLSRGDRDALLTFLRSL